MYLQQIRLHTTDLEALRPFYRWLPGLDLVKESNDSLQLWCRYWPIDFVAGGSPWPHHLILQVEGSLSQVCDALTEQLGRAPAVIDDQTIEVRDPAGNLLTLQLEPGEPDERWYVGAVCGVEAPVADPAGLTEALHRRLGSRADTLVRVVPFCGDADDAPRLEVTIAGEAPAVVLRVGGGQAHLETRWRREPIEIAGVPMIRVQHTHGASLWPDPERPFAWGHTHPWVGTAISMVIRNQRKVDVARLASLESGGGFGDQGFGIWVPDADDDDSPHPAAAEEVRRAYEAWLGERFDGPMLVLKPAWRDERGPGYMPQRVLARVVDEAVQLHRSGPEAPWLFRDPALHVLPSIEPDNPEWAALEPLEALLRGDTLACAFVPPDPEVEALCRQLGLRSSEEFDRKLHFLEDAALPTCFDHYWYWLRDVHGMREAYLPIFVHGPGVLRSQDQVHMGQGEAHPEPDNPQGWPRPTGEHLHAEKLRLLRSWSMERMAECYEGLVQLWCYLHGDVRRQRLGEVWRGAVQESKLSEAWFWRLELPPGVDPFVFTAACEASLGDRAPAEGDVLTVDAVSYRMAVTSRWISSCRLGEGWKPQLAGLRRS